MKNFISTFLLLTLFAGKSVAQEKQKVQADTVDLGYQRAIYNAPPPLSLDMFMDQASVVGLFEALYTNKVAMIEADTQEIFTLIQENMGDLSFTDVSLTKNSAHLSRGIEASITLDAIMQSEFGKPFSVFAQFSETKSFFSMLANDYTKFPTTSTSTPDGNLELLEFTLERDPKNPEQLWIISIFNDNRSEVLPNGMQKREIFIQPLQSPK